MNGAMRAGTTREPVLVERDKPAALVRDAVDCVLAGRGALLVIEGSAGLGKSAVLAAAAASAAAADITVLDARGRDLERDLPFGVLLQLLERPLAARPPPDRARLLAGPAAAAGAVFAGEAWPDGAREAARVVHGAHWICRRLAERTPLLLVIDDVQWADRWSLTALLYLAERIGDLPLAIAVSVPPSQLAVTTGLVDRLTFGRTARRARLAPLSASGVGAVADAVLPAGDDAFADACARATGGNPLLLTELLADLRDRGMAPTAASVQAVLDLGPRTVAQTAFLRIQRLGAPCAELALAVAVLGDGASLRDATRLAGLEPDAAAAAADALAALDILAAGEPLRFAQPLVVSAVHAAVPPASRARMHLRAARMQALDGADAGRVSGHLLLAGPSGDAWAVDALQDAARGALAAGAPEHAARLLLRALDEPLARERRASVLADLGVAEARVGVGPAVDRLEQALALLGPSEARPSVALRLASLLADRGRRDEAAAVLEDAMRALDANGAADGDAEGPARATQGGADGTETREAVALAHASIALMDPARAGVVRTRLDARRDTRPRSAALLATLAVDAGLRLRPAVRSAALAREALALAVDGADGEGHALVRWPAVSALLWADDLVAAERACDDALAAATAAGDRVASARARGARAAAHHSAGRLAEAVEDAEAALDGGGAAPATWRREAAAWLCLCRIEQDDTANARAVLERLAEAGQDDGRDPGMLAVARARMALEDDDLPRALSLLDAAGCALAPVTDNPAVVPWRSEAALIARRLGDAARARALVDEDVTLARRFGAARALGVALRAAGLVHGGEAGVRLLRESARTLERSPARLERARTLADLGAALCRQGARRESRDVLHDGLELAIGLEASRLAQRIREELVAAGARPRRRDVTGPGSLTPGERRVALLAAGGLTNRQIAGNLYVTEKAVEWHLRHVYRKLGAEGRHDLGALLPQ